MLYAFILGKNTALSVAEILSVLKRDRFVFVYLSITSKALIIKTDKLISEPQKLLGCLGGSIKIAEIFMETEANKIKGPILGYISSAFQESKFIFGISSYGFRTHNLGIEIKKELKKIGVSSRLVMGKEESLSAPEIKNNKILEKGADFILIQNQNKIFVGKTVAIQDYESYSHRDFGRPRRNAKSGMLPPKVAQIMLNLIPNYDLQLTRLPLIYDPFCGQGTVLQEALLLGLEVIGSDNSPERIYDSQKNLEWLAKEYNLSIRAENIIFQADALALTKESLSVNPDAIVSEVYLGPPLDKQTTEKNILGIIKDLEKEYTSFLHSIQYLNIQYFVLAFPYYNLKNKRYYLNIFDSLQKIGYNVIDPFEKSGIDFDLLPEYNREQKTILYSRPDQIVGREIVILEKKDGA